MRQVFLLLVVATLFLVVACEKSQVEKTPLVTGADIIGSSSDSDIVKMAVASETITSQKPRYMFFNPGHVVSFWQKRQGAFARYADTNVLDSIEFIGCYISGTHVGENVYFLEERADVTVEDGREKYIPMSELTRDPRDTELWPQKMFNSFSSLEEAVMICSGTCRDPEKTEEKIKEMSADGLVIGSPEGADINSVLVRYYYEFSGNSISVEDARRIVAGK